MKTRMWIYEEAPYGVMDDKKFYIDDPVIIPRVGEFIDGPDADGWVDHIQYNYGYIDQDDRRPYQLVINVKLRPMK